MKASILKNLPTGWRDEADAMTEEQLRAAIIDASANLRTIEDEQARDEKLQAMREALRDLSGGYSDGKKAQRAKVAYALARLEESGKL